MTIQKLLTLMAIATKPSRRKYCTKKKCLKLHENCMAWRGSEREGASEVQREIGKREWGNLDNQQHESLGMQCQKR